jgi:hypothetical protein
MPGLLSGKTLRSGGSNTYIQLSTAQPQLPPTPSTSTGYTLVTDDKLVTTYRSSLGNLEFDHGTIFSNETNQDIKLMGTGTGVVIVEGGTISQSTSTGALVIQGGVGISESLWTGKDIHVNGLTIGQGFEGLNNIVIQGTASAQVDTADNGQESIVIGYDALGGLSTSYKSIAIGRYAASSGTSLSNTIAIGDSALKNVGILHYEEVATISAVTLANPVVITTLAAHGLTSGTFIKLINLEGTVELNNNDYYVGALSSTELELYQNINLSMPLNGTTYTPYTSSGTVNVNLVWDNNIAIGTSAAENLRNGEKNFFLGDNIATNLTTGSYNFFAGHDVASNITNGSGIIAIGGDNLVDGVDNQINIGSVFYYNGQGYTQLNSNLGAGIGTDATALQYITEVTTATQTWPVTVTTLNYGISTGTEIYFTNVGGMIELNNRFFYASYVGSGTNVNEYICELYRDPALTVPVDGITFGEYTTGGEVNKLNPTGALSVEGGVGVKGNLIVADNAEFYSGMYVESLITGTITKSINLAYGHLGSIPYQSDVDQTSFIPIGAASTVLISDGTTATWQTIGDLSAGTASTATDADNIFVNAVVPETTYYIGLTEQIGDYSPVDGDTALSYITTTETTSSYFTTGTNVLNVPGSIYGNDGNADEANLLYTPRVTVSITAPENPRIGDFWIDPTFGVELQYINDGGNRFWIQFTGL